MCDQEYKAGVVYLDNAATTRMAEEAEAAMQPYLVEKFGNASTAYGYGEEAQAAIAHAREVIAASLDARPSEIYFTSGGSEADNKKEPPHDAAAPIFYRKFSQWLACAASNSACVRI